MKTYDDVGHTALGKDHTILIYYHLKGNTRDNPVPGLDHSHHLFIDMKNRN